MHVYMFECMCICLNVMCDMCMCSAEYALQPTATEARLPPAIGKLSAGVTAAPINDRLTAFVWAQLMADAQALLMLNAFVDTVCAVLM